jgi:hypothetical protein
MVTILVAAALTCSRGGESRRTGRGTAPEQVKFKIDVAVAAVFCAAIALQRMPAVGITGG